MCDAFLQNYSSSINNVADPTTDLQPTLLLFQNPDCTGNFSPRDPNTGEVTNNTLQENVTYAVAMSNPAGFFVPFNIGVVRFDDGGVNTLTVLGPTTVSDTSLIFWDGTSITLKDNPIQYFTVLELRDWETGFLHPMCMGRIHTVGPNRLIRFEPARQRCDYFMQNQFCINDRLTGEETCGCYNDLVSVKERSVELGVDLPVLCFGEKCATTNTYKSNSMLSKPCNITVCEQKIQESGGNLLTGNDAIFCAGHFFGNTGELTPSVTPVLVSNALDQDSGGTPYFVWILLGVSAVLFLFLAFLMFSKRPPKSKSNLDKLKQYLKSQRPKNNAK
jgi:hypothetical protein